MSLTSALVKAWQDGAAAFTGSGYALFCIEANISCIIILAILFNRQQNSSDQTEADIIWGRLLFVQILYCLSGICRVLADIGIFPQTYLSQYVITSLNLCLFGCMCWLIFLYMERSQNSGFLESLEHKIFAAVPFCVHVIMLIMSLFEPYFIDLTEPRMKPGILFPVMLAVNLMYPLASAAAAVMRRRKMTRYEREAMPLTALYPATLAVFAPLQALNWRMPLLCYVIVISDILVSISHSDSMIRVDPLTKIPNRNGLMHSLSERLGTGNQETLHVFAVDVDGLETINSLYGRIDGDKTLILVSEALKKFQAEEHQCFISRYYGDEFILTADIQDKDERELFIEHIRNYVSNASIANRLPYYVRVSVGWSKYEQFSRTETIAGLIEEAEQALSENREQRRFQSMWRNSSNI